MSSGIQQLEINYHPVEDRLILKIYTLDLLEFRFFLTRRFTKLLWNALHQLLEEDQKTHVEHAQETAHIAQQFEKEQKQRQPTANKFATKMTKTPMGEAPLLLTKISGKSLGKGILLLKFEDAGNRGFEINADSKIILSLCKLISEGVKKADWDLDKVIG